MLIDIKIYWRNQRSLVQHQGVRGFCRIEDKTDEPDSWHQIRQNTVYTWALLNGDNGISSLKVKLVHRHPAASKMKDARRWNTKHKSISDPIHLTLFSQRCTPLVQRNVYFKTRRGSVDTVKTRSLNMPHEVYLAVTEDCCPSVHYTAYTFIQDTTKTPLGPCSVSFHIC